MCRLYQARHANNGLKIPARLLMDALGGNFPKAYNSRVNKVYDWRNKKYQKEDGTFSGTHHQAYLVGGINAPSLSTEYKEILAYEHKVYAYAETYLESNPGPDGIASSKQLAEKYILDLEHSRPTEIKAAIEKGRELEVMPDGFPDGSLDFNQMIFLIENQMQIIASKGSTEQKSRLKKIAFRFVSESL